MKATVEGNGVICTGEQNKKRKKYAGVQIVHFRQLLQVDVISKTENSLVYIGRQVNSLTGLSSLIFSPNSGESIVEDGNVVG